MMSSPAASSRGANSVELAEQMLFGRRGRNIPLRHNFSCSKKLYGYEFGVSVLAQYLQLNREDMVLNEAKFDEVNVLTSGANWGWPAALRDIFRPRGVNLLVAENAGEFVDVIRRRRIHTTIVDMDSEAGGLATIKIIRIEYPVLPCILLSREPCEEVLSDALGLDVFSVIDKPVDMGILREQLNRLFIKRYNNDIFS